MKNRRHVLSKDLVDLAKADRDAGRDSQYALESPRGLSVRVRAGEISYTVQARSKGKDSRVTKRRLAGVGDITFTDAKNIATEVIFAIKNGRSADAVIEARLTGGGVKEVSVAMDRADASRLDQWTFRTLINAYAQRVKHKPKSGDKSQAGELVLAPTSIVELEGRLRDRPECAGLMDRFVRELRLEDLELVRDRIDNGGSGPSAAAKFVELAKRVLRWGLRQKRLYTGLEPAVMWWEALSHDYKMGDRSKRFLTPSQVGMLIALLEAVRGLEKTTNDAVLGAFQVSWMIPQRSAALVNMRAFGSDRWVADPSPERAGWWVYTWMPGEVKNKREVKLSVPPRAVAILERVARYSLQQLDATSIWAFPQDRNRYVARAYAEKHPGNGLPAHLDKAITASALNHALDALAGRKDGWLDLLSIVGLPSRIGPHDLRKSITTFFDNSGQIAYASALLDHRISGSDKMSNEVAIVTQSVYSAADRVIFKAEGMAMWMDAVWPEYEKAKNDPRLALAVERHVQHLDEKAREASKRAAETKASRRKTVKTSLAA